MQAIYDLPFNEYILMSPPLEWLQPPKNSVATVPPLLTRGSRKGRLREIRVLKKTGGRGQGRILDGRLERKPSNLAAVVEIALRNQEIQAGAGRGMQKKEEGLRGDDEAILQHGVPASKEEHRGNTNSILQGSQGVLMATMARKLWSGSKVLIPPS